MIIYYFDCQYNDYEEAGEGEHFTRIFRCSHPDRKDDPECLLPNFCLAATGECDFAERKDRAQGE